jgi:hypothetical protein
MRKSLLLALTLSFVYVGTAQAQAMFDRAWGAKAGVSVSTVDANLGDLFDTSNQTGFAGGLFFHNYWGILGGQLEASYIQKGFKVSGTSGNEESNKLGYIELAALLKAGLPLGIVRPGLFGGIGFDIKVSCSHDELSLFDCDDVNSTDWVGILGGDVYVYFGSFSVFGDARYNVGLSELSDAFDDLKNKGWTFQAGVGFQAG